MNHSILEFWNSPKLRMELRRENGQNPRCQIQYLQFPWLKPHQHEMGLLLLFLVFSNAEVQVCKYWCKVFQQTVSISFCKKKYDVFFYPDIITLGPLHMVTVQGSEMYLKYSSFLQITKPSYDSCHDSLWSWWPEDHMWPPVLPPMQEGPQLGGFYGHQQSGDTERWHFEKMLSFCDNFCEFTSYYWSMSSQIMLQTSCQGQSLGLQPHKINCEHLQGDLDSVRVIPISVPKRKNSQHPTTFFDRNRIYCNSSRGWLLGLFSFCYWGAGTKTPCMISNNM